MTLSNYIKRAEKEHLTLPCFHTTMYIKFFSILDNMEIRPKPCGKFKKDFSYYFYGKASFSYGDDGVFQADNDSLPVTLIFDTSKITIEHIYPFDSGGFMTDRFNKVFKPNYDISEFEIGHCVDDIKSYIETFFENNENYLKGQCQYTSKHKKNEFLISSFVPLLSNKSISIYDDRANTIEVISSNVTHLKNALIGLVIPESFCELEVPELAEVIGSIEVFTYNDAVPYNIREMIGKVKEYSYQYIKKLR